MRHPAAVTVPDAWSTGPLPAPLAEEARQLIARLSPAQRLWLSGWLAGSVDAAAERQSPAAPEPASPPVTVLFGSQSGNAERAAREAAAFLQARNVPCTVMDMLDCGKAELAAAHTVLVVVSTQGEGDPPDRAVPLWELLAGRRAPALGHLRFAVLGLGDSSYQNFCETGKRFDARLEALGATRLLARVDCDVDFDASAATWMAQLAPLLARAEARTAEGGGTSLGTTATAALAGSGAATASVASAWTRRNPFSAAVLLNQRLTARDSSKDVRHVELSLEGSGIRYEPGDAIGIVPRNAEAEVDAVLAAIGFDADAPVVMESHPLSLREALLTRVDLGLVDDRLLEAWAPGRGAELRGRVLLDVLRAAPRADLDPAAFIALLRPLAPRLYSIASSQRATPDEVHLTVGVAEFDYRGERRQGLVSGAVAALVDEDAHLPVYLHRNAGFRLPAADLPVVMIGPGTGIAPFRSFVAERAATGAKGRNWLFFGDRHFETDFLYQSEWLGWRRQGVLTRIDVAFSRDQPRKLYVQHRIQEHGAELWRWLQDGAHVYVCGDAKGMAPDVHQALLAVAQREGGLSHDAAAEWLTGLTRQRRYQRDVY